MSTTYQLSGPRRAFAPRFTPCSVKDGDIVRPSLAGQTGRGSKKGAIVLSSSQRWCAREGMERREGSGEQIEDAAYFYFEAESSCLMSLMMADSAN